MEYSIIPITNEYLGEKELRLILDFYPFQILNIENIKVKNEDKPRAVYKIYTSEGIKCLKKVYHNEASLLFIYSVIEWLYYNKINCPRFLPTKQGKRYVKYNDNLFVLMDWIEGRKCDYDKIDDVKEASKNLAKIHVRTTNFKSIEGSKINISDKSVYESYSKHFNQLLNSSNRAFYYKDKFSKLFLEHSDYYIESAKESLFILSQIDFSSKELVDSICHYDYVNKNIIFTQENDIYVIDFDKCKIDYSINDLYIFIKRILKRKNTCWDFEVFKAIIESYEENRKISNSEFQLLLAQLIFPQKFWKLSYDYFKNINVCNKKSFYNILKNIINQKNNHQIFTEKLINYYRQKY
ncbi:MAG: CotS family spore coat protein [Clostridiales bacterium]|nr:CotS family spore coat protein [Clostridiales bacterium]